MRYPCAYSIVILLQLAASLESGSFRERCPRPHLKNGWVKLRSRGRIAKFNCIREFQLLGEKFATCLGGEWDNPPPLCVRPGCEVLDLSNGQMMATYRGAVITFLCNPGYRLQGSAKLYCDGKTWNGTAPQCTAMTDNPALSCDFESEDLCGWSQDPHLHFNWTRLNHNTPSGSVGTGPSYDHTFGKGNDGYYLYIETSGPRKQNNTARLYSPVYGTEVLASQPSCFIFWYHMYGATVGSLAVYIKPDNMELTSDIEAGFTQAGNKGDVWLKGVVNIPPIGVPFQIIIEGVRGPGYVGDTAIDDVRLANGSDCEQPTTVGTIYGTDEPSPQDDGGLSCRLRCMMHQSTPATAEQGTMSPYCDCHSSCRLSNTCCKDYSVYCNYSAVTRDAVTVRPPRTFPTPPPLPPLEPHPLETFTIATQTMTTREDVFRPIPIPPDPTPLIIYLPTRPTTTSTRRPLTTTKQTTVALTTTTTAKKTTATTTTVKQQTVVGTMATKLKPTIAPTTVKRTTTKQPTVVGTMTTAAKPTVASITVKRTTTTTTTTKPTVVATVAPTTAKRTTTTTTTTKPTVVAVLTTTVKPTTVKKTTVKRPRVTSTTTTKARPPIKTTISTSTTSTTTTPASVSTLRSIIIKTKSSSWSNVLLPSTTSLFIDVDTHGKEWKAAPKEPLMQNGESAVPISLIAGIAVFVGAVAVISIVVSILIRQRRKSRSQQNLAEDSDVRFLTVDEILDFTLAQPKQEEEYEDY